MSYARWSDDCDVYVYVYGDNDETVCVGCCLPDKKGQTGEDQFFPTLPDLLVHLRKHIEAGNKIPADVIKIIEQEIASPASAEGKTL